MARKRKEPLTFDPTTPDGKAFLLSETERALKSAFPERGAAYFEGLVKVLREAERERGHQRQRVAQDTEDATVEGAERVLRARYWQRCRNDAEIIMQEIRENDIKDQDELESRLDSISEVIYTHDAADIIRWSENGDAYWERMSEMYAEDEIVCKWQSESDALVEIASHANRADIIRQLEALGLNMNNPFASADDEEEPE